MSSPPSKNKAAASSSENSPSKTSTSHQCSKQQQNSQKQTPPSQQQQTKQDGSKQPSPSHLLEDLKRQVEGQLKDLDSQEDRLLSPRPATPSSPPSRPSGQANGSNSEQQPEDDNQVEYYATNEEEIDNIEDDDNDEMVQIIGEADLLLDEADIRRITAAAAAVDRPEGADGEDVDEGHEEEDDNEEEGEEDEEDDDESSSSELELTIHGSPAEAAAVAAIAASEQVAAAAVRAATTVAFPAWIPAVHHHQHHQHPQHQQAEGQRPRRRRHAPGQAPAFRAYLSSSSSTYAAAGEDQVLGLGASGLGRLFARGWQRRLFRQLWRPAATVGCEREGGTQRRQTSGRPSARLHRSHSAESLFVTYGSSVRATERRSTGNLPRDDSKTPMRCPMEKRSNVENAKETEEQDDQEEKIFRIPGELFDGSLAGEHRLAVAVASSNSVIGGSAETETALSPGTSSADRGEHGPVGNFRMPRRCLEVHSDPSVWQRHV